MLEGDQSESEFETDMKVRAFYKSCKNRNLRINMDIRPLQQDLKRIGGLPIVEGRNWSSGRLYAWHDHVLRMVKAGFYKESMGLIQYGVSENAFCISLLLTLASGTDAA